MATVPAGRTAPHVRTGLVMVATAAVVVVLPLVMSEFRLALLSKYLVFAVVAVGLNLAWGYGGMLSLGHGVFFGLGAYCTAMHLKLAEAGTGLPDFMSWSGVESLPAIWAPFRHAWFAIPAAVIIPTAVAALLGASVFRRRVRGAYFALLTQALAAAFAILLIGQQGLTGGTNGLTNITELFGLELGNPRSTQVLFFVVAGALAVTVLVVRQVVHSRFGRLLVAVRDGEDRVRFLGYDATRVKVVAFAVSAGIAGLAGALFVPIVGIISPANVGVVPSIEMVIWVAIGGRATLLGPVVGAVVASYANTSLSEWYPGGWLYLQGALFVVAMVWAPRGLAGVVDAVRRRPRSQPAAAPTEVAVGTAA
ncbi:MAG: urea ABC transporter permease subunit UrtC [Actinobacteria bacterium]|nr:urea ABC transporter permease subunit UrtC [Actinomycetota bacterium]